MTRRSGTLVAFAIVAASCLALTAVTTQAEILPGPVPADAIVTWAGLEWVWASPCSGGIEIGCSLPLPTYQPDGWRYATADEMANKPDFRLFMNGLPDFLDFCAYPDCKCASAWFDPVFNNLDPESDQFAHCDVPDALAGLITSEPNNSFWESWFVRDIGAPDADGDGIPDASDLCPGTVIPEGIPQRNLLPNHFALVDNDNRFDTVRKNGGPLQNTAAGGESFTLADTKGCSCQQIVTNLGLGPGQERFGCNIDIMNTWVSTHQ